MLGKPKKKRSKTDVRKFLDIEGTTKKKCWKKTKDWKTNKYAVIVTKLEQEKKYEDLNERYNNGN